MALKGIKSSTWLWFLTLIFFQFGCQSSKEEVIRKVEMTPAWRPLNVVVVTIDTLRADHLGCYGYSKIETPVLDHLAENGALFERAVSQVPNTPPSHASIFTGTYPTVHQVRGMGGFTLGPSPLTLATILQQKGWKTAAFVGSTAVSKVTGLNQGFQVYDDKMLEPGQGGSAAQRRAGRVVDQAISWLRQQTSQTRFFLWVHVYDPHAPYDPPSPFREKYSVNPYDGEIAYTDRELGRLLETLQQQSPSDNTLLAVLSDHGESLSEHGEYSHGVFIYDSTLHIPWIMAGPGIPKGFRVKGQVRTIDLLPTVMDLLGGETPSQCQGVSLVPAFSGERVKTTYSYSESLIPKIDMGWAELRGIRTDKWKYIRAPRPELYDLENDPNETNNVIKGHPADVERLEFQLRDLSSTGVGQRAEVVRLKPISAETEEQLRSLGYVWSWAPLQLELTGEGIDPKERVHILKLIEEATTNQKKISPTVRIQLLQQALKEDPTNSMVYFLLGDGYEAAQRDDEALRLYQKAVQQKLPGSNKICVRMAKIFGRHGKVEAAIAAFEKAVEMNPSDLDTQNKLAVAYLMTGKTDRARQTLKAILSLNEADAQAHNGLGWIAMNERETDTALSEFQRALQLDPDLMEAYINLGMLYKAKGDYNQARSCFETFLAKASGTVYKGSIPKIQRELALMTQEAQGTRPGFN
jgi:choline-sulfatase